MIKEVEYGEHALGALLAIEAHDVGIELHTTGERRGNYVQSSNALRRL
jgi:hypothetical protein